MGTSTARERQEVGGPVVIDGVMPVRGRRESCLQGEGVQVAGGVNRKVHVVRIAAMEMPS